MDVEDIIKNKLSETLKPELLVVTNESDHHAGHAGSPGTGQSHFRVEIKAESLKGLSRIESHRKVNECLREELKSTIHALAIRVIPS